MNIRETFDISLFQERLRYDPETGYLHWIIKTCSRDIGDVAGTVSSGYVKVKINGVIYLGHRIAWSLHYGVWPNHQIDHIDMDGTNNRINNLRRATNSENMRNRGVQKNNMTGMKGVYRHNASGGYTSSIGFNGEVHYLGYFKTPEEAKAAYDKRAKELHGKFYRGQ